MEHLVLPASSPDEELVKQFEVKSSIPIRLLIYSAIFPRTSLIANSLTLIFTNVFYTASHFTVHQISPM